MRSGGVGGRSARRRLAGLVALAALSAAAGAGDFELLGLDGDYQLQGLYSAALRLHRADGRLIDAPPDPDIPLPDYLKVPQSNNFDDGNRNFDRHALVNNRVSLLGEVGLAAEHYGLFLRGDAFHDQAYRRRNDNDSPDTINKTALPVNAFTDAARRYDGRRARLLDAYVYANWDFADERALSVKLGRHVVAWGESLFFSGVALAQGPADATKSTVPGADVKSILLPVEQLSLNFAPGPRLTLLAQYKLAFKPVELSPVGEFFSVADLVGPGAEFLYGIQNPFYLSNLADLDLSSAEVPETLDLALRLLAPDADAAAITGALGTALEALDLPALPVPVAQLATPGVPRYINAQRTADQRPSDHGQWGLGLRYQLTPTTTLGAYRLRYHNTTPAPVQTYGYATLIPGAAGGPGLTTQQLDLLVPVSYRIRYFDGIDLSAMSLSTTLFGANIGGELIWREGVDVLVDVDGGLLGPVPTPTRARLGQVNVNGLYIFGPGPSLGGSPLWDSAVLVADLGFVHVEDVAPVSGPDPAAKFSDLTYTRDAAAYQLLGILEKRNVFDGWDVQLPLVFADVIAGHSSLLAGFGSLQGEDDYRVSAGVQFTYLLKLTLGLTWSGYFGEPDLLENPYADRDNLGVSVLYRF